MKTAGPGVERGEQYLENADTRLTEIEVLALTRPDDLTTPALVDNTLADFTAAVEAGADEFIRAYLDDPNETSIADLRNFTDESTERLDDLLDSLPDELRDDVLAAAEGLTSVDEEARQICPACSSLPALDLPGTLMDVRDAAESLSARPIQPAPTSASAPVTAQDSRADGADAPPQASATALRRLLRPAAWTPSRSTPPAVQPQPTAPIDTGAPPPAPTVPQQDDPAPTVPQQDDPAPTVPQQDDPAPTVPQQDDPAPTVPQQDDPAPTVPQQAEPAPTVPRIPNHGGLWARLQHPPLSTTRRLRRRSLHRQRSRSKRHRSWMYHCPERRWLRRVLGVRFGSAAGRSLLG